MHFQILKNKKIILGIFVLFLVSFILYFNPLFSEKPLGVDAMGHLSKVAYMKEFGFVSWDMSWYGGGPFLRFYSPLFYYLNYFFKDIIFGANFLCFIGIFFCSAGIFLLVYHYTKKEMPSLIAGLFFLSVLNTSYYYISVGNHPYVFSLWLIPFSLLFLEKSFEKRIYFLFYNLFFVLAFLSHVFTGLCIGLFVTIRFLVFGGFCLQNIKKMFIFLVFPLFLSSFWLFPFLSHSSSYMGEESNYIAPIKALFGFDEYTLWGKGAAEIGISLLFLIFLIFIGIKKKFLGKKRIIFSLICLFVTFLLLRGILGKYYPTGIGAIRFINTFSIFICISIGLLLKEIELNKKKYFFIFFIVLISLIMNFFMINENFKEFSHNSREDYYGLINHNFNEEDFPVKNEYTNYRFGSARYQFSETLTYEFPRIMQISGYYDQGILYPETLASMKEGIWGLGDLNSTLYYMDWMGIKYFELSGGYLNSDNRKKFNSSDFTLIKNKEDSYYPFEIYEYKTPNQIISLIRGNLESYKTISQKEIEEMAKKNINSRILIPVISEKKISIKNNYSELNSSLKRNSPDYFEVSFEKNDGENFILFREFYYASWNAKEYPSGNKLKIFRTANNFMLVIPSEGSEKIVFYQTRIFIDYEGIFISLLFLVLLFLVFVNYRKIMGV